MAGTGIVIRFGKSFVLAEESDVVGEMSFDGECVVETVRAFRSDRARSVPRGGQLDAFSFTVSRQHESLVAALKWLLDRRRAARAVSLEPGQSATVVVQYGTPYKFILEDATVTPGPSTHRGISTFESFTLRGAIADKV